MEGTDGRTRPWVPFVVPAAVLGVAALALRLRDPHVQGTWGFCPSAALGIDCPGCGTLRGINLLTHGDVVGAASSNLLTVTALPLLVLWWCVALVRQVTGHPRPWGLPLGPRARRAAPAVLAAVVALLVVYTVLRNAPGLGAWAVWLAP